MTGCTDGLRIAERVAVRFASGLTRPIQRPPTEGRIRRCQGPDPGEARRGGGEPLVDGLGVPYTQIDDRRAGLRRTCRGPASEATLVDVHSELGVGSGEGEPPVESAGWEGEEATS